MSRVLDAVQAVVPGLVQEGISKSAEKFSWDDVPTEEKWKLTWGVWGRQILVNIAMVVVLFLILAAMVGVFGN